MQKIVFNTPAEIEAYVGRSLGPSDWLEVTQGMIDDFARSTGDSQWIHVDVERAAREMPGGRTIAHGFLVVSLFGRLQPLLFSVENVSSIVNYGSDKARFLAPVPSGSRIRLSQVVRSVERKGSEFRVKLDSTFELEGASKPALFIEVIWLYVASEVVG